MRLSTFMSAIALLAAAPAQGKPLDLNIVSRVEVQDAGGAVVISIQGSKPPNFTTFSMLDPPRFVVDFSESRFRDVPEEMPASGGLVKMIRNLSYGSDASSIARVMIAFEREIEPPEVQASGTTLLVKVAKNPGSAGTAVASATPAAEAAQPKAPEAAPLSKAEAAAQAKAAAKAQAEAAAKAKAQAKAEAKAAAEAAVQAKAEAKARAQAEAKAAAEAAAQTKAQAKAEAKARAEAAVQAKAEAKAQAKATAEAAAQTKAKAKAQAEVAAQAEAKAEPVDAPAGVEEVAQDAAEPEGEVPEEATSQANSRVQEVGFLLMPDVSRVFIRTSSLPEYTIQDAGGDLVRVELANTRVERRNDARFLDTSYFPSAVAMVTPRRQGSTYVLEIRLKQRVAYQQKIEGAMLAIDFERPAAMRSAAPSGPAADENANENAAQNGADEPAAPAAGAGEDGNSQAAPSSAGSAGE